MDPAREAQIGAVQPGGVPLSPDELASILRSVADGITAQGPDGRLVFANDAAARLCGAGVERRAAPPLGARSCSSGSRSSARTARRCRSTSCRTGSRSPSARRRKPCSAIASFRAATSAGRSLRSTPLLDDAGEVHLVINVFHDITDERSAEARIRFLAEASTLLSASLDYEATLADLGQPARPADRRLLHRGHDRRGRSKPSAGRDLAPGPRAGRAAARAAAALPAGGERGASGARRCLRAASRSCSRTRGARRLRTPPSTRSISRSTTRSTRCPTSSCRSRREAGCSGRSRSGTGESGRRFGKTDLELAHEIARRAALAIDNARPLRSRAGVVRAARHAARVGAGGHRLLGPRPPLRPRERRARRGQPQDARGACRPDARRGDPDARARAAAALPAGTRVGRAAHPHRVDRRRRAGHRRAASLALQLLPGAHRRERGDRRRRGDHGDHRSPACRRSPAPARGGRGALLELARPGRDRGAHRSGDRAAARRLLQRLRGLGRLARARCLREQRPEAAAAPRVAAVQVSAHRRGHRTARARLSLDRVSPVQHGRTGSTSRSSSASAPTRSTSSRSAPAR